MVLEALLHIRVILLSKLILTFYSIFVSAPLEDGMIIIIVSVEIQMY